MKIQIRKGLFETNSSSVHSIVIGNNGEDIHKGLPTTLEFYGGEFGWEHEIYDDPSSKASYLYTSIINCQSEIDVEDTLKRIKEILEKWGIKAVFEELDKNNNFMGFSYVDHAYDNIELIKKLISDEDLLMNYLFSTGSSVETGNDNDETEFIAGTPKNVLYEYEKGN
jgi:hypothetical protein